MVSTRGSVTLGIGDVYASARPTVLRTTVGSCIAVCLFDPGTRIGGMNHFMLPGVPGGDAEPGTYGTPAMELLLRAMERAGASRDRLIGGVFGGGHVIDAREHDGSVPARNIAFIRRYCAQNHLRVRSFVVGGRAARQVTFETWSGEASCEEL